MSLDLTPRPGAAPTHQRIARHVVMELRLLSRQGEQLLVTLVIPLLVLFAGSRANDWLDTDEPLQIITPGVLGLAILSTSFTSLAISTGFERRYGVLKRLGATPLSPQGLFWGKGLAVGVAELVQMVVLISAALALGWRPAAGLGWIWFIVVMVLSTLAFAGIGLLVAGTLRAEITLAVANLLFVLAVAFGGLVLPVDRLPAMARPIIELLPTGALGESMRDIFTTGSPQLMHVTVLAVWAVVAGLAASRWFRWE